MVENFSFVEKLNENVVGIILINLSLEEEREVYVVLERVRVRIEKEE